MRVTASATVPDNRAVEQSCRRNRCAASAGADDACSSINYMFYFKGYGLVSAAALMAKLRRQRRTNSGAR